MITDYDCWHEAEEDVTVDAILAILRQNATMGQSIVRHAVQQLARAEERSCPCANALQFALVTDPAHVPAATRQRLDPIVGRYLSNDDG